VCTSDCPLIAQEFRQADLLLGAQARRVEMVAVATNPVYYTTAYTRAFDRQEGMDGLANWHFVTGSLAQLRRVWQAYGVQAYILPAGGMIGHTDVAWAINSRGEARAEMQFDPGPGTQSTEASFAAQLAGVVRQLEASR
jgi:cytochrome oxidase Cu insertion factor (SCO1/SenC/PrrC family)